MVFFADGFSRVVVTCLSQPETFAPLARGVTIPANLPRVTLPLFSFVWPPGLPAGPYTFFIGLLRAGALADAVLELSEIGAVAVDTVTYVP